MACRSECWHRHEFILSIVPHLASSADALPDAATFSRPCCRRSCTCCSRHVVWPFHRYLRHATGIPGNGSSHGWPPALHDVPLSPTDERPCTKTVSFLIASRADKGE